LLNTFFEQIMKLTKNKGADCAVIIAPSNEAFEEAPKFLGHNSKLIVVGQPPGTSKFDMTALVMKSITMTGSMVGTRLDLKVRTVLTARPGLFPPECKSNNPNEFNSIMDFMRHMISRCR
jgi:D-arabinose 1-dehydrogenase-like Zn-dependent alcohol dehydrogenase